MEMIGRRRFLTQASNGALIATFPLQRFWGSRRYSGTLDTIGADTEPGIRFPAVSQEDFATIAAAALAAARTAGATYAEVHVRTTHKERWFFVPYYEIRVGIGVRALSQGYWGFAGADGVVSVDSAARLGTTAALEAKIAARGKPRTTELAPAPVAKGSWTMPVEIDPFTVSFEEKKDFLLGITDTVNRMYYGIDGEFGFAFMRETRNFASSEGASTAQTVYATQAGFAVYAPRDWLTERQGIASSDQLSIAGAGWEYVRNAPVQDSMEILMARALSARRSKPVEVGRYDVVFDAQAIANILDQTVVTATELDRAMGYEANGVGTSFLNDPVGMLGTYTMGSRLLNVTANRSMPGGAATVKWDDEGVEPQDFTLVKDGILTDFQTTREAASWLASYYQKAGKPVYSNGCAGMYNATSPMQQFNPNIVLHPGPQDVSFDDLVKSVKKGLAFIGGHSSVDYQALNGTSTGSLVYEIVDGKLAGTLSKALVSYRGPEFWKGLVALGGRSSVRHRGLVRYRDNGETSIEHTVSAVPVLVTGVSIIDFMRKA